MKKKLLEMLSKLEETNDVVDFFEDEDGLFVEFNNVEGFDEDDELIERDYVNEELVYQVLDFLDKNCKSQGGDLYEEFVFDDFNVLVGYSSYHI